MDAEQQAVLDSILGQSPTNQAETVQATDPAESTDSAPAVADVLADPAPSKAPEPAPEHPSQKKSRHDELMERLMSQARQTREQQVQEQEIQRLRQEADYARRLREAAQYGPDAVLRAAGVETKKKDFDLAKLFSDEKEDLTTKSVKQLEDRIAKLDAYIKSQEEERQQEKQTSMQRQQQQWAEQEIGRITNFLDTSKDKFEYLSAARELGSEKDLYNGMISLYNQGYQPTYEDMADIVESRIEKLLDLIGPTAKFKSYVKERYGVQLSPPAESKTLTSDLTGDSPGMADIASLPDDQQKELALKAAFAARERALKALGK